MTGSCCTSSSPATTGAWVPPTWTGCARIGPNATCSSPAPTRCSTTSRDTTRRRGRASACTWSASSPSSASAMLRRGRAGRSPSSSLTKRPSRMAASPSWWPARRPASTWRTAAARASATRVWASCAPAASATCATARSTARRARSSGSASTPPRAPSKSSCRAVNSETQTPGGDPMTATAAHNGNGRAAPAPNGAESENPLHRLSAEQIEALGREFDELHEQVKADLGDRDATYIRSMIAFQRKLALIGRAELIASRWRVPWLLGGATLGMAKILENMEIGHNVMHGQWDWMNDPVINSRAWDWDTASTAEAWRHSHNFIHHTYTNIIGKDRDLGYEIMRIDPEQGWHPIYLFQPVYNILLAMLFERGVAVHALNFTAIRAGEKDRKQLRKELKGIAGKARTQIQKDYIAWPLISGIVMTLAELASFSGRAELERRRRSRLSISYGMKKL